MKSFQINIAPQLQNVTVIVKNGAAFSRNLINGSFYHVEVEIAKEDIGRVKKFSVKYGNDKSSNRGKWYAHCNGYAMDLMVDYKGKASLNTYRPYGKVNVYS